MALTLVDTSAWIHALRPDGAESTASRVRFLLESGEAAWCPVVKLEMWNGARGGHEKSVLAEMDAAVPCLPIDGPVWEAAYQLAQRARDAGLTVPATDLLVVSCARHHRVGLVHADSHFELLGEL